MGKKGKIIDIIMAVIMSLAIGALATFLARRGKSYEEPQHMPLAGMLIKGLIESVVLGVIVILIFPIGKWGKALADKVKVHPPGIKFSLINAIPYTLVNTTVVGGILSFINIMKAHGEMPDPKPPLIMMWLRSQALMFPVTLICSYILAVILAPVIVRLVIGRPGGPGRPEETDK